MLAVLMLVAVFAMSACSESSIEEGNENEYEPEELTGVNSTAVVYFSATGNTKQVAEYIAKATGGDLYEIQSEHTYTDEDLDYTKDDCYVKEEQDNPYCRPGMVDTFVNTNEYDVIYLGYPIWYGTEPRIIDTWLEESETADHTIIPFCTSASSGIEASVESMKDIADDGTNFDPGMRFAATATYDDVKAWTDTLHYDN